MKKNINLQNGQYFWQLLGVHNSIYTYERKNSKYIRSLIISNTLKMLE
jgi:hypothetical protein